MSTKKTQKKKTLKVKVQRCYYVTVVDETGKEVWDDFWFGTRDEAKGIGEKAKKGIETSRIPVPVQLFLACNKG